MPGTTSPEGPKNYLTLGGHLGINPWLAGSVVMGGATAGALIQQAALAIDAGMAEVVACVFADTARTGGSKFDAPAGRGDSWGIWGMFGNAANSAMTAQRHMALYGTTSEQLGWVAVTCRKHASLNPARRDARPDHDRRPPGLAPDRRPAAAARLLPDQRRRRRRRRHVGGAGRSLAKPPVRHLGMGQGHTLQTFEHPDWWYLPHQRDCLSMAYRMAGVGPADIDVAQLYDNFTSPSCSGSSTPASASRASPARSSRAASASPSAATCRSTRRAATCPSRTCRAGCTSSRACGRSAASAATAR